MYRFRNLLKRNFCKMEDHYNILGVNKNCSDKEIHEAYIKKSKEFYNNINLRNIENIDNSEYMNKLIKAYGILSLENERSIYDMYKKDWKVGMDKNPLNEFELEHMKKMKQIQKMFNIDDYGRIKGGLPNKDNKFRGGAIGKIGEFHDVEKQRELTGYDHQTELTITNETTNELAAYKIHDKEHFTKKKVWYKAKVTNAFYNYSTIEFQISILKFVFSYLIIVFYFLRKYYHRKMKKIVSKIPTNTKLGSQLKVDNLDVKISSKGVVKLI